MLRAVQSERPTNLWLAPSMVNAILQSPGAVNYDTSSVRLVINGARRCPKSSSRGCRTSLECLARRRVRLDRNRVWGHLPPRDRTFDKLGSIGKPVMHLDLKILDAAENLALPGSTGEIVLRGPKVVSSYWKDSESTAGAFADSWFHTGDIGHLYEAGFLYIDDVGRT